MKNLQLIASCELPCPRQREECSFSLLLFVDGKLETLTSLSMRWNALLVMNCKWSAAHVHLENIQKHSLVCNWDFCWWIDTGMIARTLSLVNCLVCQVRHLYLDERNWSISHYWSVPVSKSSKSVRLGDHIRTIETDWGVLDLSMACLENWLTSEFVPVCLICCGTFICSVHC